MSRYERVPAGPWFLNLRGVRPRYRISDAKIEHIELQAIWFEHRRHARDTAPVACLIHSQAVLDLETYNSCLSRTRKQIEKYNTVEKIDDPWWTPERIAAAKAHQDSHERKVTRQ